MSQQAETDQDSYWHPPADGAGQEPEAVAVEGKVGADSSGQAYAQAELGILAM